MVRKNTELQLYMDALIIQAAFGTKEFTKKASAVGSLIESIKGYVGKHIEEENPVGSVMNILAPGAVKVLFSALNLGWLGWFLGLGMVVFNIDVESIWDSIVSEVHSLVSGGKPTTSEHIDSIVAQHFEGVPAATEEEAGKFLRVKDKDSSMALREAQLFKYAMVQYDQNMTKQAGILSFITGKAGTKNLLAKAIGWIIKTVLAAGGLMVVGDAIHALMGRPSAFTGTLEHGKPTEPSISTHIATQTKFKIVSPNSDIPRNTQNRSWIENVSPTRSNILDLVVNFTEDVYPETQPFENIIKSDAGVNVVVNEIEDYNITNTSHQMTFIPRAFSTKKKLVDIFIDEIAKKAGTK